MINGWFCDFRERQLVAEAKSHGSSHWLVALQGLTVSCSRMEPWQQGLSLWNDLRSSSRPCPSRQRVADAFTPERVPVQTQRAGTGSELPPSLQPRGKLPFISIIASKMSLIHSPGTGDFSSPLNCSPSGQAAVKAQLQFWAICCNHTPSSVPLLTPQTGRLLFSSSRNTSLNQLVISSPCIHPGWRIPTWEPNPCRPQRARS